MISGSQILNFPFVTELLSAFLRGTPDEVTISLFTLAQSRGASDKGYP